MSGQQLLAEKRAEIAGFCRRWQVSELAVFGSVLSEDFGEGSDVDVLVTFAPEAQVSLFDLVHMKEELEGMLGRGVDLVERAAIEQSENYLRRKSILSTAEPVYVAS